MSGEKIFNFTVRSDQLQEASLSDSRKFVLPADADNFACPHCAGEVFRVMVLLGHGDVYCASCHHPAGRLVSRYVL
jgi:hypothetical protein